MALGYCGPQAEVISSEGNVRSDGKKLCQTKRQIRFVRSYVRIDARYCKMLEEMPEQCQKPCQISCQREL